jgi:hypothetical protein
MSFTRFVAALTIAVSAAFAQAPLPGLRVEPTDGGSILYVKNGSAQPLTAFLVEMLHYPGSYYALWQDDVASEPIPPGVERRIPVTNMTIGAAPEYVKLEAALFADGTSSGVPGKVTQLVERRRFVLETTRDLAGRLEKARSAGTAKDEVVAELNKWADSFPPPTRSNRTSQAAVNNAAAKSLIEDTAAHLKDGSLDAVLAQLRTSEKALEASKPAL